MNETPDKQPMPQIYINQDYPQAVQARRRILMPIFRRAKTLDQFKDNTHINMDKLIVL